MRIESTDECGEATGSRLRPEQASEERGDGPAGEVTVLLQSWAQGDAAAEDQLFERIYPELRRLAAYRLRSEHIMTLQLTELANETYLRLADQGAVQWSSRDHFFAVAATMARRILVDRARHRGRRKRGDGTIPLSLELDPSLEPTFKGVDIDVLDLDAALVELRRIQRDAAQIVELRFFGGHSVDETARILGLGKATVVRKWRFAKAWLTERLGGQEDTKRLG